MESFHCSDSVYNIKIWREKKVTLGHKIQEITNARGMSQEEFGEMLGTTRQTVSKWELDQASPDIKKIVAMSRLFCVPTDELLLGYCSFHYDFDYQMPGEELNLHFEDIKIGQAENDSRGFMYWFVKRYGEEEIVLAGCGSDEYVFRKDKAKLEYFM